MLEDVGWDFAFNTLQARYQDTIHAIYRVLGHHRAEISRRAVELQRGGETMMPLDFPDPLARFKEAFHLLLAPKELADIDITNPQLRYRVDHGASADLTIDRLSSGEKEVFAIVFDLLLRDPEDCIVFFDEPELHLHPELSFRLLKTLQTVGSRNQFVFCTHSADIISASIEHSVVFLSPRQDFSNQGILVKSTDESVAVLKELGQSLGVISLGRKIVLIEGSDKSLDRDTYGAIFQARFPGLVLAPSGARQTILSFARVVEDVLDRTVWGIEFYMLADRDNSLPEPVLQSLEARSAGRLRFLPRYHLENYFLDEDVVVEAFRNLASKNEWLQNAEEVRDRIRTLAREAIPIAVNLWLGTQLRSLVGELDVSVRDVVGKTLGEFLALVNPRLVEERTRVLGHLDLGAVEEHIRARWAELEKSLEGDAWKRIFPGKMLMGQFCGQAHIDKGYFRNLYISAARRMELSPFREIIDIVEAWAGAPPD